jgi:hypothetical protein
MEQSIACLSKVCAICKFAIDEHEHLFDNKKKSEGFRILNDPHSACSSVPSAAPNIIVTVHADSARRDDLDRIKIEHEISTLREVVRKQSNHIYDLKETQQLNKSVYKRMLTTANIDEDRFDIQIDRNEDGTKFVNFVPN